MACCVIAAFLVAQFFAMLRRWGMFWGLVPIPEGETVDTALNRIRGWLASPKIRMSLAALVLVEITGLGGWLYVQHGTHIAQAADIGWSKLHGQYVVYTDFCSKTGQKTMRLVLDKTHNEPDGHVRDINGV